MAETQRRDSSILGATDRVPSPSITGRDRPQNVRFRSKDEVHLVERYDDHEIGKPGELLRRQSKTVLSTSGAKESPIPGKSRAMVYRFGATLLLLGAMVPLLRGSSFFGHGAVVPIQKAEAGVIPIKARSNIGPDLTRRADSDTNACFRWAQQSAIVNGTLYLYGGEATTEPGQDSDTWNNDFLTMDLTKTWQIGTPSLTGLPQPSGPPAVSLGYLWNSYESLFMYGGEYSWKPVTSPEPLSVWEYSIADQSWIEHSNPTTSSGVNADSDGEPVQRSAEGAGVSVPSLGRGFYFGGHQDGYTTPGWSQSTARIYLQSLLEFTFPGYANDQVNALGDGKTAGTDGNYRNITSAGLQENSGFTKRADGVLMYVPGFGEDGILLALAGGTNITFTQMNVIDVYDIASSTWYKQATAGPSPTIRVNPCAGMAAAPDGSSYNIYMFGGQNLTPQGNQSQFDDVWILTLPSFTWIEVDQSKQSVPPGRSGHTCNVWDGQMVVVGGYTGGDLTCDSPGVYVYDMSNVQWVQQFTALSPGSSSSSSDSASSSSSSDSTSNSDSSSGSSASGSDAGAAASASAGASASASSTFNSTGANNPLNQQPAQLANGTSSGGILRSYGYVVPQIVIDVIGGGPSGGATVTVPAQTATGGPLATGRAVTYTVTQPNGATVTETGAPGTTTNNGSGGSSKKNGPNIAAIVVGVVCGILFIVLCYVAFCAYVYRRQLKMYKRHVEMSQAQARGEKVPAIPGLLATNSPKTSSDRPTTTSAAAQAMWSASESASQAGSNSRSGYSGAPTASSGRPPMPNLVGGYSSLRRDSDRSSTDDNIMDTHEPTFVGVLLNPRRSLKVVNRD
ncbi:hypothetical protein LTR56_006600 [Elasticomyces elasticus]|nr:hypothetical protein LTR56_006600 [Elasticomyces elasticus]